jgi:hypothetical protein
VEAYDSVGSVIQYSHSICCTNEISEGNENVFERNLYKFRIGKVLSDAFPIQSRLNQGDAFSPLLFNTPIVMCSQESQSKSGRTVIKWSTLTPALC